MFMKPIKETISTFTISFNYFDYQKAITKTFFDNLMCFVTISNPLMSVENAYDVDLSVLKDININHFNTDIQKKKHINLNYLIQIGGFSEFTVRAFQNYQAIEFDTVEKILEFANTDINEYMEFLNSNFEESSILDIEVFKSIVRQHSPKKDENKFSHYLFRNLIYCQCGCKAFRKTNRKQPVYYYCMSKNKRTAFESCDNQGIKEEDIVDKIFEDTGVRINKREQSEEVIEKITVSNNRNFIIDYLSK